MIGFEALLNFVKTHARDAAVSKKIVIGLLILLHLFSVLSYWNYYTTVFARESADAFLDGYIETMELAHQYEKGLEGKKEVSQIIVTTEYGQPYIYSLFVRKTNPIYYQGGSLIKYQFADKITVGDFLRTNTLLIATPSDELPIEKSTHIVYGSDGKPRFILFLTE